MKLMAKMLTAAMVFGLVGVAQAKEGATSGLKGKIVSVMGNGKIVIQTRAPRSTSSTDTSGTSTPTPSTPSAPQTITIQTDSTTTVEINGQSAKVTDLQAGEMVVIQGDPTGIVSDIKAMKGKSRQRVK